MTEIVGTDIPTGDEVKWYHGGVMKSEQHTVTAAEVTAGEFALAKKAEYGSVWARIGTTNKIILEYKDTAGGAADDTSGTLYVAYSGMAANDVVDLDYVDIDTTALTQIAACKDVKSSLSIDTKEESVHGQVTKLKKTGATSRTADLEELDYNDAFVGAIFGNLKSDTPDTGDVKWIDRFTGVKKIGVMVGKRLVSGVLKKKYFLIGVQATKLDHDFPTEGYYAKSFSFLVDYMMILQD